MTSRERSPEDEQLLGALTEGTLLMLSTMFGVDGVLSDDPVDRDGLLVGSSLRLESDHATDVVLTLARPAASQFVATMVACDPADVAEDLLQDGVGEMVNIIAGNAKAILASSAELHYRLCVPERVEDAAAAGHDGCGLTFPSLRIDTQLGSLVLCVRPAPAARAAAAS